MSTITKCEVASIGFKAKSVSSTYFIGDFNYYYQLPEIVQEPDCNYSIEDYEMILVESSFS